GALDLGEQLVQRSGLEAGDAHRWPAVASELQDWQSVEAVVPPARDGRAPELGEQDREVLPASRELESVCERVEATGVHAAVLAPHHCVGPLHASKVRKELSSGLGPDPQSACGFPRIPGGGRANVPRVSEKIRVLVV